ncbi:hypothetical protein Q4530_07295 [Colwellia sp. 1_MG-2023]|uniref:hypothetical protein n=1 Tax=unclassified Colwellia TaxID=196834 RepID=UPI001C0A43B0|nr:MULTISPECIES: hypothetical protein [unclassified Colwellia]MBU2926459.1 hypothetical protein [Colwellia sp. C2M11]MDO6487418.1 hypothetical protein [Colwellia sp. 6_MG-2023]MDO6652497.1 hypothetical protein [Colwellia sp. 3_MG-2023]MDO6665098.1 hypothetical protein [Colwellia sp. 2_MG-2023]MDO6689580.1 hypothetical protein [Colwellia sp. 1_MG-2023]
MMFLFFGAALMCGVEVQQCDTALSNESTHQITLLLLSIKPILANSHVNKLNESAITCDLFS